MCAQEKLAADLTAAGVELKALLAELGRLRKYQKFLEKTVEVHLELP
jgi:hypothetical protein